MLRQYSHDRAGASVKIDRFANHRRVRPKVLSPKLIAENRYLFRITGDDAASMKHCRAQHREEVFGCINAEQSVCLVSVVEIGKRFEIFTCDVLKQIALSQKFYGLHR